MAKGKGKKEKIFLNRPLRRVLNVRLGFEERSDEKAKAYKKPYRLGLLQVKA